jgi:hypothetical protein
MTTYQTRSGDGRAVDEDRSGLLRLVLKLDAVASDALGALSLAAGPALDDLLGTPLAWLVPVGAFLVIWTAALWVLTSRSRISRTAVWVVIGLNLLYAVDAIMVVVTGWFSLSALGTAFVLAQAIAVALFAAAQFYALRRAA